MNDKINVNVIKTTKTGLFSNYIYKTIPLAFDESMSYYETLCGLLSYLENTIIPTVDNNADAVIELQNLFETLQDYVNHYFDNLDVQEEINNKLDEMVEDGTFENTIFPVLMEKKQNNMNKLIFMPVSYYTSNTASGLSTLLIDFYDKKTVMFDTGYTHSYNLIKNTMENENVNHIDYLIISHYHDDHFMNYQDLIYDGFIDSDTICYLPKIPTEGSVSDISANKEAFIERLQDLGCEIIYPNNETVLNVGNCEIDFLNCDDTDITYYEGLTTDYNNYSIVNYVKCGKTKVLLSGDIRIPAQTRLMNQEKIKKCNIINQPHHSADEQVFNDFFVQANPEYGISSLNAYTYETYNARKSGDINITNAFGCKNYITGFGTIYSYIGEDEYSVFGNSIPLQAGGVITNHPFTVTLNVDSTYTGEISNGTVKYPFKTLTSALAYARSLNTKRVTISFVTSYSTDEKIEIESSIPSITINQCTINSIEIHNSDVTLNTVTINGTVDRALVCYSSFLNLTNCVVNGNVLSDTNGRGIVLYQTVANANTLTISNKKVGISLYNNSTMYVGTLTGDNNTNALSIRGNCVFTANNNTLTNTTRLMDSSTVGQVYGAFTNNPNFVIKNLASGDDLDNFTSIGSYPSTSFSTTSGLVNKPTGVTYGATLRVSREGGIGGTVIMQEFISTNYNDYDATKRGKWIRTNSSGTWTEWIKVY